MIIRDEEGRPISAEKVSDVSDELARSKKKLGSDVTAMSDEEKKGLLSELSELKDILHSLRRSCKSVEPIELMGFMKQVLKIKTAAENSRKNIDD